MLLATTILGLDLRFVLQLLVVSCMAIVFLQSGLDKIIDSKGNRAFIKSHFEKTFLGKTPFLNYFFITLLETLAGICSALGILMYLFQGNADVAIIGLLLSLVSLLSLLFGQRIAKDYEGASVLMGYIVVAIFGLYLFL